MVSAAISFSTYGDTAPRITFSYSHILFSRLLVRRHDHLYTDIRKSVTDSWELPKSRQKAKIWLGNARVILCTITMLSSDAMLKTLVEHEAPPHTLIVDEASQLDITSYLIPLLKLKSLSRICFVGDDKQCGLIHWLVRRPQILTVISPSSTASWFRVDRGPQEHI